MNVASVVVSVDCPLKMNPRATIYLPEYGVTPETALSTARVKFPSVNQPSRLLPSKSLNSIGPVYGVAVNVGAGVFAGPGEVGLFFFLPHDPMDNKDKA